METQKALLKDEDGEEVDVHMYRYQSRPPKILLLICGNHTLIVIMAEQAWIGSLQQGCHYMDVINNHACKKQIVGCKISTTKKAEYVAVSKLLMDTSFGFMNQRLIMGYNFMHSIDEDVHKELGDSLVRATINASSLEAE
ncbi:hypothetical protein Tco_0238012 [Tanacetum coccineum]